MHALRVEREGIYVMAGRKATTHRGIKQVCLCLARMGVAQCGQQVHPDQTKAVKGQDCKTLATASAIKRPLSCPVEKKKRGDRKTEYILRSEKKKQSKKKREKDKKENREEKKGN